MLHLLIALSSIPHLHAIAACIGTIDVIGFTILYVRVQCDVLAMRNARASDRHTVADPMFR